MNRAFIRSHLFFLLLNKFSLRHWLRAPRASALLVLMVACGVGVFLAVRLANRAAVAGFSFFTESVSGRIDLVVSSPSGVMRDETLMDIRALLGDLPVGMLPVLEMTASLPITTNQVGDEFFAEQFRVVGLDVPALPNLVYFEESLRKNPVISTSTVFGEDSDVPDIFISDALSRERNWSSSSVIELMVNERKVEFEVSGVIPPAEAGVEHPVDLIVADLPDLQRVSGLTGMVDRIELRIPYGSLREGIIQEVKERLSSARSPVWRLELPERSREAGARMTAAFRMNLTILSGLALLVGIYLILQSLEAAVVRRRSEIAVLRSLGVTSGQIRSAWLAESAVLGVLGSLVGLFIGWFGAQFAVRAVARTVDALYLHTTAEAAAWHWGEAGMALALGVGAGLLAGWLPSRDAAATPPAQLLRFGEHWAGLRWGDRPLTGIALIAVSVLLTMLPPLKIESGVRYPIAGYLAVLTATIGAGMLIGRCIGGVAGSVGRIAGVSAIGKYAVSQLRRPSGRHRLAATGLMIAMSMVVGMSILIRSFEVTMERWVNRALQADLYVAPPGVGNAANRNRLSVDTWKALAGDSSVSEAEIGQMYPIEFEGASTYLVGANFTGGKAWRNFVWIAKPAVDLEELRGDDEPFAVLINESFSRRFGKDVGDRLTVPTPMGGRRVVIAGIFSDYGNERGAVVVERRHVAEWFDDDRALNLAIYLRAEEDPESVRRRWLTEYPGIVIRTNRRLRDEVMRVFGETFSVTYALKWLGMVIALVGQGLAVASIIIERKGELTTLNSIGLTKKGIAISCGMESCGLAAGASLGGILLGLGLGHVLIAVINPQSFGWTLAFVFPWSEIAFVFLGVVTAATLIGMMIGRWGGRLPSDREE